MTEHNDAFAAQNDRAYHHVGDVGFGSQKPTELCAVQARNAPVATHARADECRPIVEEVELAGELLLPIHVHHLLRRAAGHTGVDGAVEDDEEVDRSIAGREKHGAARQPLHHAEAGDALDLISSQPRECL
jgi:hypothetical protein